jgi:hypothetical protein
VNFHQVADPGLIPVGDFDSHLVTGVCFPDWPAIDLRGL